MRVFTAALVHETSGLSPIPTSADDFRGSTYYDPRTGPPSEELSNCLELGLRQAAARAGHEIVDSLYAAASPSSSPASFVYEELRDRILEDLAAALPVDAVLLFLHGAQMAQGFDDCEGDLLRHFRSIIGKDVPVGIELDLHGHITPAMIDHADILAMCMQYPHTDFAERAQHVLDLVEALAEKRIAPQAAFVRLPMMGVFHTTRDPMRKFVEQAEALQGRDDILSVSIQHGFATCDSPNTGAGILVIADGDAKLAHDTAKALASEFFSLREAIRAPALAVDAALEQASALPGPVVIADTSDNAGGGAGGDSTFILRRMIARQIKRAAVGALWDPIAVDFATKAGVGAHIKLRIGGKVGPLSGDPVDVDAKILAINPDLSGYAFGQPARFGPHVALEAGGITIVLCKQREQTHSPQIFTELGIDLGKLQLVVVKSAQHFHAAFAPLASAVIYACPPGTTTTNYEAETYHRLRRPIWPIDATPFEIAGETWG